MDCSICVEKYNESSRKKITCKCNFESCLKCVKTYILEKSHLKPHCMSCRTIWTLEMMQTYFSKYFMSKDYRQMREKILFEEEKTFFPDLLDEAKRLLDIEKLDKSMDLLYVQLDKNHKNEEQLVREQRQKEKIITEQISATKQKRVKLLYQQPSLEKKVFIMKCIKEDCKGFLSEKYKCGLCSVQICKDCHCQKEDDEHKCDQGDVETVTELLKTTKPCPKCHIRISKIDGCFAKNQPILMYDSTIKMSQDINVGDILVGDDGEKRTVNNLMRGEDEMYEVKQNNGDSYIVNSKHKLVLKYTGDRSLIWTESLKVWKLTWFCRNDLINKSKQFKSIDEANLFIDTLTFSDEIEITVSDYINLSEKVKNRLFGFKSSNGLNHKNQVISLDPYLLGVWLGDGTHTHPIIASNDYEIQKYIMEWCKKNNAELVHIEDFAFRIRRCINKQEKENKCKACIKSGKDFEICKIHTDYNISNTKTNPFMSQLKKYNLIRNKHIPLEYMNNDLETRLLVLAGLIDTDGHVSNKGKRATIIQTSPFLSEQIIRLARSCGFVVNIRIVEKKNKVIFNNLAKDYKNQYHINISGKFFHNVKTILNRKKCIGSDPNKDYYKTSIEVTSIGKGEYYGWSVDGNKRFLLPDYTVVRNCDQMFCIQCHTPFSWKTGKEELGVIHNPHYFEALRNGNIKEVRHRQNQGECGPIPQFSAIDNYLYYSGVKKDILDKMYYFYQKMIHHRQMTLPLYINRDDRTQERLKYLTGKYDEKKFKQKLFVYHESDLRKKEEHEIMSSYVTIGEELFRSLSSKNVEDIHKQLTTLSDITKTTIANLQEKYRYAGFIKPKDIL